MNHVGGMTAIVALVGVIGCTTMTSQQQGSLTGLAALQRVKHVFVITLENKSYDVTFGTSTQDPYLNGTLKPMGALLTNYYATGHVSHDNYIAMISGQPASRDTQSDCQTFNEFTQTGTTEDGIPIGSGCVYPASIKSLPDQMKAVGLTWKGYMEDMGNDPARESATCGHPVLNTRDATQRAQAPSAAVPSGDQYAARHNPFVYFHSIIDSPDCATNVVALDKLEADIASVTTTPNFVFITPNLCNDGHDGDGTGRPGKGCVNGDPGGLTSADKFLQTWVPKILASPAFKKD
jgi:phosphatidylinositol-3-phosphatase